MARLSVTAATLPTVTRLAIALLLALVASALAATVAQARPNIVFVMTDDQTVESMKVMTRVRGQIQDQGTTFTRNFASFPLCCPSRATYLTGQYAHDHGVINNVPPFGGYVRLDHTNTLPVWLQRAGYRTISVGRYLNGYGTQNPDITEIPPGWNDWITTLDPTTYDYRSWRMNDHGRILQLPGPDHPDEFQTDYLGRRAAEMIEQAAPSAQPFFLSLTFPAPHSGKPADPGDPPGLATPSPAPRHANVFARTPLPPTPGFDEKAVADKPRFIRRRSRLSAADTVAVTENYQQELESLLSVDEAVGNVLGALTRTGELDNTLVIFTSDNGFMHGEHRIRAAKVFAYEPSIRVPLAMRGPGVPRGLRLGQPVANIDLAPTILDAADAMPGRLEDGTSLFKLLGDPTYESGREVLLENGDGLRTVSAYRGIRNDRYSYLRYDRSGERELYDLRRDPFQLANVAKNKRYDRIQTLLSRRLRKLERCHGARACAAGRPAVALGARCEPDKPRYALHGREKFRVESVRYVRLVRRGRAIVRAHVTMVDGRRATYDHTVVVCTG
jgi:arylsulfatase A-like enzyme